MSQKNQQYHLFQGRCEDWFPVLDKKYLNRVKLIYLDPPYNTKRKRGARRSYSDHNSNWSEMMYPILEKSYRYLSKSGFLAISINQMEMFNLMEIAKGLFKDGFIGVFPVKIRHPNRQLMINATFHNVYEYLLLFRKNRTTRFYSKHMSYNKKKFCWKIKILDNKPIIKKIGDKQIEIYTPNQYEIIKVKPSPNALRKYLISGKIATANWSGEIYEKYLKNLKKDHLVKVYGLEKNGLGYRWFLTSNHTRSSGIYFQSTKNAGRPHLPTNFLDYTDIVTYTYREGGLDCDFKDSKKPEEFINTILDMTTKKNDLVMDFFGGSGTTLSCCIKKQRSCIVIEKSKPALRIIKRRLKNMQFGKDYEDNTKYKFKVKLSSI